MNNVNPERGDTSQGEGTTRRSANSVGAFSALNERDYFTEQEARVVNLIQAHPGKSDRDLSNLCRITHKDMTAVVSRLETKGCLLTHQVVSPVTNRQVRASTYIYEMSQWVPKLTLNHRRNAALNALHILQGDLSNLAPHNLVLRDRVRLIADLVSAI